MILLENMGQRIKKFGIGIVDEKLTQAAAIFFALIIVKLIPQKTAFNDRTNRFLPIYQIFSKKLIFLVEQIA